MISKSTIKFSEISKYDLNSYFNDCSVFFKTMFPDFVKFYNGQIDKIKSEFVYELERLLKESVIINQQFKTNSEKLETAEFWELIDFCEQIKTKLETSKNISKYLRSSRVDYNFTPGFAFPYLIGSQETLENISQNILGDDDSNNDWTKIALQNDLKEVDYSIEGDKQITLYKEKFIQNFVTSVYDNMIGEKIYGLDINKKITFVNDDLEVLSYKNTVFQTVNILSNLKKGDIPEFVSLGVNASLYVGSNIANLAYSAIVRELTAVFSTDDLFIDFKVKSIKLEQDTFFVTFEVNTKYKLLIESQANL